MNQTDKRYKRIMLRGKATVFIDWANVHGWEKSLKREVDAEKLMVRRLPSLWRYIAWLPFWRTKTKPSRVATRIASFGFGRRGTEVRLCGDLDGSDAYGFSCRNKFRLLFSILDMKLYYLSDVAKRFFEGSALRITTLQRGNIRKKIPAFVFFDDGWEFVDCKSFFHGDSMIIGIVLPVNRAFSPDEIKRLYNMGR